MMSFYEAQDKTQNSTGLGICISIDGIHAPIRRGGSLKQERAQDFSVLWVGIFLAYVLGTYVFLFLAFNLIGTLYVYIGYLFI